MANLIEETNKIINKIDKNLSETLRRTKVEILLDEIKADLETLKKSSEEKHKKIVDKKVEELQNIIDENFKKEPAWTETQDDLGKIKKGLVELKSEVELLSQQIPTLQLPTLQLPTSQRPSFTDSVIAHEQSYIDIAVKAGEKEGILGMGTIAALGTASVFSTGLGHLGETAVLTGKEFVEKGIETGANVYENTRKGLENVTTEAMGNAADVTKSFFDIFKSNEPLEVKIEMLEKRAQETVEAKDMIIKLLEKQLEEQRKELAARQGQINSLLQQQSASNLGVMQIAQTLATSRPSSPTPPYKE